MARTMVTLANFNDQEVQANFHGDFHPSLDMGLVQLSSDAQRHPVG